MNKRQERLNKLAELQGKCNAARKLNAVEVDDEQKRFSDREYKIEIIQDM